MPSLTTYGIGKTNDIPYNPGGKIMDLYRIANPSNISEIILYIHGGYFMRGTEENQYALDCATKFNAEGYNVISMAYTLQTELSYAQAMAAGGQTATYWWLNAVISATNDLIDAIEFIKALGINKINIIGYSAGATMALLSSIGPNPFTQTLYGLKTPDRSVMHTVTAIAGSLTTPTDPPTEAWQFLDENSPKIMLWQGTTDTVVPSSGAQAIKNKYDEMIRSNDCTLNLLEGVGHDDIWSIRSTDLSNSLYDGLLPLGAAAQFININQLAPVPICFPAGTLVTTNQGNIAIEKLNPDIHTIRGKKIVAITQTKPLFTHIVSIEKHALGKNVPSTITQISNEHKVFYKGEMTKAKVLVDMCEGVSKIPYNGETLYNVLLKKHDKMMVNNLICETLDPRNIMAKICGGNYNHAEQGKICEELNEIFKTNNVPAYKTLYESLK
jgi:predicted esterase